MSREQQLSELLAEGLGLCVRARRIDEETMKATQRKILPESAKMFPEVYGKSGTPYLWMIDQYDKDLADWETRARKALSL